jgi:hypothetical protein
VSDSLVGLLKSNFLTLTLLLLSANEADYTTKIPSGASVLLSTARQAMQHNVILRYFRATIFAMEKK